MNREQIQQVDADNIRPTTRRLYAQASLLAFAGNLLLLVAKGLAARASGSSAVYADAANSASDLVYSLFMGLGLWLSLRPPDTTHPHGHRRIESLVSLAIGIAMALAGVEAARTGLQTWQQGGHPTITVWPILTLLGAALVKAAMYLAMRHMGLRTSSPALLASARDNLSDTVSSAAALVGLLGSLVLRELDPLAALLVTAWILRGAWQVLSEGMNQLIGGGASPEIHRAVVEAALAVPGVLDTDRVIIEHSGPQVYVDIHIRMQSQSSLDEVHHTSHAVRDAVQELSGVDHVFVHVEPWEPKNQKNALQPGIRIVVLDDDPTGIQTVHGCLLLTQWDRSTVTLAFEDDCPFFYILTNTRAYASEEAREITRSAVQAVLQVNKKHQDTLIFISRSDSTLRSHFPTEVDEITRLLEHQEGTGPDATFLVPAFFEGGRVTCNDTHYIREGDRFIPIAETEFARDSVFRYSTSHLPGYIEEKTGGRVLASTVRSVTLDMLRDPEPSHLADWLRSLNDNNWAVVNAECYEDLHRFTETVRQLVETGRRYVFQSAASLVKSLSETPDQPLLGAKIATGAQPGFFVVGSHVRAATAQLKELLACPGVEGIEVDVRQILNACEATMRAVLRQVRGLSSQGSTPVLYTSRQEMRFSSVQERIEAGQRISGFLSAVVRALPYSPSYLVAKGGITSHDVLAHGLELVTARVLGQILPGVPVVKSPPDHRFGEMPYVIFPGNVGGPDALTQVCEKLNPKTRDN